MHPSLRTLAHTRFETALGECAIAWSDEGVAGVALPATDGPTDSTGARVARRFPGSRLTEASGVVAAVIDRIRRHLNGALDALCDVQLDLRDEPGFHRQVYALTRAIAPGSTSTYGDLARQLGDVRLARAVGQALGANPCPLLVPCHRVLAASGAMHGFSAPGGIDTKYRLLSIEGAPAAAQLGFF